MKKKKNQTKVFVTGGTGFVGQNLIKALVRKGFAVKALVRKRKDFTFIKKLGAFPVLGDLSSIKSKDLKDIDIVYHCAAIRADWGYTWDDYYRSNVLGIKNLLEASLNQVKHFIFVSSVKAAHPNTLYGKSKLWAEKEALKYYREKNLPLTIIRPTIVYGPGDDQSGMMVKFIKLIKNHFFMTIGSGENRLHLIYIDDLVKGFLLAGQKKGKGQIYNLAYQKPIKIKDLVSLIAQILGVWQWPFKLPFALAMSVGFILEKLGKGNEPVINRNKVRLITSDFVYQIEKTQKELGFSPKTDYPEGLQKTIEDTLKKWS